jgi:tetratricopeptide (TPR) repeat protein
MAKSSKPTPKNLTKSPVDQVENLEKVNHSEESTEKGVIPKIIFWVIAVFALITMLWAASGVGINADDKFQVDYSKKLVNYYGTMGRDTSALFIKDGNMHLYGGFFDTFTGFANKIVGNGDSEVSYFNLRHYASAMLGWMAILFAGLFAWRLAGLQSGIITLVIAWFSPRFFGDSLMNPKDIPFAAGYMMAIYYMVKSLDGLPKPSWKNLLGLALGIGLALATRAGGLLLFAYLGLFGGLHLILRNGGFGAILSAKSGVYAKYLLPTAVLGYFLACVFWPYAMQNPLKNPLNALSKFSDLEVHIRVLFGGENVMSDKEPRFYAVQWIWRTIPLGVLIGLVGYFALLPRLWKKYTGIWVALAGFAAVFPVFYVILKDSVLHDGWRHLTFAYLPMVICAALFWNELVAIFSENKMASYAIYGILGVSTIDSANYILQNPRLSYTYFNPLAGGIKSAYGNFETDYWGISTRQGIEWLEKEGILNDHLEKQIVIATNFHFPAKMLVGKYGDKVKIEYLKWEKRCDKPWDYAMYPTRFLEGSQIRAKDGFPPKNAVHIIRAGGVPILAIMKNDGNPCAEGMAKMKVNDLVGAIADFTKEVKNVPNNEVAWANLGQVLLNNRQLDSAVWAANKCLEFAPDNTQAINLIGLAKFQKGDLGGAKTHFEAATRRDPTNAAAWYYLAMILAQQNNISGALTVLQKCLEQAPSFQPARDLATQLMAKNK